MATIEELIKQHKFDDEKHKSVISILYIANLITSHYDSVLKEHSITCQQYNVLRILRGQKSQSASVSSIKERLLDKSSDASRIVERLRKLELVDRVVNKKDRRSVDVLLTKKGLNVLKDVDEEWFKMEKPTNFINEKEAATINKLLQKYLDALAD
jgi:DNA-binding MarR family transcriptional regulator